MANPVYAIAGFRKALVDKLKDPKLLPLSVLINPFINETNAYADYIVPGMVTYESWGISVPWADAGGQSSTVRAPVVTPRVKMAGGEPVSLESFLFACARTLDMPGFGAGAVTDKDGNRYDLDNASDFYLRAVANIAFSGGKPVGEASDDDLEVTGMKRYTGLLQGKLKADEWRQVAMVLTRGGRFDKLDQAWEGDHIKARPAGAAAVGRNAGEHAPQHDRRALQRTPDLAAGLAGQWRAHAPEVRRAGMADADDLLQVEPDELHLDRRGAPAPKVHPDNPVSIHRQDAERLGIASANGQPVRITSPGGSITGVAIVRHGVMPGTVAVEYGYGHQELGARPHRIDGQQMAANAKRGCGGVNMNDIGIVDDTRGGHVNGWIDTISGAAVRQGLPVRVELG